MKNLITSFAIILILLALNSCSQEEPEFDSEDLNIHTFQQNFGALKNDTGKSIVQLVNGNYVLAGITSYSNADTDILLIETNSEGTKLKERAFHFYKNETVNKIISTSDGGFLIAGTTTNNNLDQYDSEILVLKVNSEFEEEWHFIDGVYTFDDEAYSIMESPVGGYYVLANQSTDLNLQCRVIRLTENGSVSWDKNYGGSGYDLGKSFVRNKNNEIVITGHTSSFSKDGNYDFWFLKISPFGTQLLSKAFGKEAFDNAEDIIIDSSGNYLLCGYITKPGTTDLDLGIIKIDPNGELIWQESYGNNGLDQGAKIIEMKDGKYLACGTSESMGDNPKDWWVLRIDTNGEEIWNKSYGYTHDDRLYDALKTKDNGYMLFGYQTSEKNLDKNIVMLKIDRIGNP